ncbi:MAG: hypothetical protein ABI384_04985 [Allobranchiibius sp.]
MTHQPGFAAQQPDPQGVPAGPPLAPAPPPDHGSQPVAAPVGASPPDTSAIDRDRRGRVRGTRVSAVWIGLIAAAVLLILLLIFIAQNSRTVTIHYLGLHGHLSLALALLLAADRRAAGGHPRHREDRAAAPRCAQKRGKATAGTAMMIPLAA